MRDLSHATAPRQAVILAAGRGSRMGDLTVDRPKALVPLFGRPLLAWQIDALAAAGVRAITVVTGWSAGAVEAAFRSLPLPATVDLVHNPHWDRSNMIASLRCAGDRLRRTPVLVSYSDIFYTADTVRALAASSHDIAISYDPDAVALWSQRSVDPLADLETFRLAADGCVAAIGARPQTVAQIEGQFMGLLRFTPAGAAALLDLVDALPPPQRDRIDSTSLLQRAIDAGVRIGAVPRRGPWGEIDTPADRDLYERLVDPALLTATVQTADATT